MSSDLLLLLAAFALLAQSSQYRVVQSPDAVIRRSDLDRLRKSPLDLAGMAAAGVAPARVSDHAGSYWFAVFVLALGACTAAFETPIRVHNVRVRRRHVPAGSSLTEDGRRYPGKARGRAAATG